MNNHDLLQFDRTLNARTPHIKIIGPGLAAETGPDSA